MKILIQSICLILPTVYFSWTSGGRTSLPQSEGPVWSDTFEIVDIKSPLDGTIQKAYFYRSRSSEAKPLIVSLHTWSHDYTQFDSINDLCVSKDLNYIHPNFRGVNNHKDACCSELVLSDIDAAIDYALAHGNVDSDRIYVIGTSGGGYATLATFMKSRHKIKKFAAWVPLVDLSKWYRETRIRKLKYADEIMACTSSSGGELNLEVARAKSPMYWQTPVHKLEDSEVKIYCGVYDGMTGNGTIPITHSINFYNKLMDDMGGDAKSSKVRDDEKLHLLEHRSSLMSGEKIGNREVFLEKSHGNTHLILFEGGHEILTEYAFNDLIKDNGS